MLILGTKRCVLYTGEHGTLLGWETPAQFPLNVTRRWVPPQGSTVPVHAVCPTVNNQLPQPMTHDLGCAATAASTCVATTASGHQPLVAKKRGRKRRPRRASVVICGVADSISRRVGSAGAAGPQDAGQRGGSRGGAPSTMRGRGLTPTLYLNKECHTHTLTNGDGWVQGPRTHPEHREGPEPWRSRGMGLTVAHNALFPSQVSVGSGSRPSPIPHPNVSPPLLVQTTMFGVAPSLVSPPPHGLVTIPGT